MTIDVVILAAGKGTRMRSNLPKVLHPVAGRAMLQHVIDTAKQLQDINLHVVIGHGAEQVKERIEGDISWVIQTEQLGTGHAVAQALPNLKDDGQVLILYGDVPLTALNTLQALLNEVKAESLALLTVNLADPSGYGRIVRNAQSAVTAIVEQKDAAPEQLAIDEVNTGIMAGNSNDFKRWLPALSSDNAQGEYYLTDVIAMAHGEGKVINTAQPTEEWEVLGVNNRLQQAELERVYQYELAKEFMQDGLTLLDPKRFDCRGSLRFGQDVSIDINAVFEGSVELGDGVTIGANCVLKDCKIGAGTVIQPNSMIDDSTAAENCQIGPYARLRPGTQLAARAKVGNFVETKKAIVGEGSKINHLTYVGDSILGKDVNVGAGTITCNYDGVNKFTTEIGDNAFIGSNSSLVAPVKIGAGATVGAGSTVNVNVEDGLLAVTRAKQRNISWQRPKKKS